MEAANTSETSVNLYHTAWHSHPEDSHLRCSECQISVTAENGDSHSTRCSCRDFAPFLHGPQGRSPHYRESRGEENFDEVRRPEAGSAAWAWCQQSCITEAINCLFQTKECLGTEKFILYTIYPSSLTG
jgi:hypothetical protein